MDSYRKRRGWSDKFLPEIRKIVGEFLIDEPPVNEDELRNTDLMVLGMEAVRVACRVRTHVKYLEYPNDFTIRAWVDSGNKTELTKILEGWGDYLFYGFADESNEKLIHWKIIDLKVFRLWFVRCLLRNAGEPPGELAPNIDGKSKLRAFSVLDVPKVVVKEWTA